MNTAIKTFWLSASMLLIASSPSAFGIELGRFDSFGCFTPECDHSIDQDANNNGIISGWLQNPLKLSFPGGIERIVHGGPNGPFDHFLQVTSFARRNGANEAHSKVVVINKGAWTNDYLAAGVTEIIVDLKNLGGTDNPTNAYDELFDPNEPYDPDETYAPREPYDPWDPLLPSDPTNPYHSSYLHNTQRDLNIRLEFDGGDGRRIFSRNSVSLPYSADGTDWQKVSFGVRPEDLTGPPADGLSGINLVNAVLQNTGVFRFFHSEYADDEIDANLGIVFPPTHGGYSGVIGIDNIYARLLGDFDFDADEDADDIDALSLAIQNESEHFRYDLTGNGVLDKLDGEAFISDYFNTVPGDFDLDGRVSIADLIRWAQGFGSGNVYSAGDGNFDGQVNIADLIQWAQNFGFNDQTAPLAAQSAATAIPEPAALSLLLAMCGAFGLKRQRPQTSKTENR